MKIQKHILEAIQRGIKLALDDYDDNTNDIVVAKKETVKNKNEVKELIKLRSWFVDLGLPSGTLWARYNIGANVEKIEKYLESYNKFTDAPVKTYEHFLNLIQYKDIKKIINSGDWFGTYIAWGETEEKPKDDWYGKFSWNDYKLSDQFGNRYDLTKYCTNKVFGNNGFTDGLYELLPEDDIAYKINPKFRIPTKEQFEELLNTIPFKWEHNYLGITNLRGMLFKSEKTGEELFLPANGYAGDGDYNHVGKDCYYWSRTLVHPVQTPDQKVANHDCESAWFLEGWNSAYSILEFARCYGLGIRPVFNTQK